MEFNKLVRDKITTEKWNPIYGKNPKIHIANDKEYYKKLKEKLKEEVDEFIKDDDIDEIADILELLYAICDIKNITKKQIEEIRKKKEKENGAFKKRIILENSED